jgi:hypothetical protein
LVAQPLSSSRLRNAYEVKGEEAGLRHASHAEAPMEAMEGCSEMCSGQQRGSSSSSMSRRARQGHMIDEHDQRGARSKRSTVGGRPAG